MDYDAVPYDMPGPESHRIADVRSAYEALTARGLHDMGEMIAGTDSYTSNAEGHFAWDISLSIRAACLFWRVTGDSAYLEMAAGWAHHMVDRTDDRLNVENWRGDKVPAWSAGSRYTAGTATVGSIGGAPVSLQAASEQAVIERPSSNSAIIHSIRKDGTTWSSLEGSLSPDSVDYLPDLLARRSSIHSVLLRGLPGPIELSFLRSGEFVMNEQFAPHLVHTGLIARSLIAVAECIDQAGSGSSTSSAEAGELYEAAKRALRVHDDEIRVRDGQPWYTTPADFPGRRLGLDLPHNHVVDVATSFMILGRRLDDESFRSLGISLTRGWLNELDLLKSRAIRHPWYYYPVNSDTFAGTVRDSPIAEREVPGVNRGEDSSHATIRVRALLEWHSLIPRIVTEDTLSTVSLAIRRNYMTTKGGISTLRWLPAAPKDAPDAMRLGHTDTYSGAWAALCSWDPPMKRHMNSMAYRHPPKHVFGGTIISAAEIVAMNAGVRPYNGEPLSAPRY